MNSPNKRKTATEPVSELTTNRLSVYLRCLNQLEAAGVRGGRRERAVLFMDVRGFTRWSEAQPPEAVVDLLDRYYRAAESALARHATVKVKLSADEVMAVFGSARQAVAAALEIAKATGEDPCNGLADAGLMAREFPDLDLDHPWDLSADAAIDLAALKGD